MPEFTWYIIQRHSRNYKHIEELDAIECETMDEALKYARDHYGLEWGQSFHIEPCITKRDIRRAQQLSMNCAQADAMTDWTEADWQEFVAKQDFDPKTCRHRQAV